MERGDDEPSARRIRANGYESPRPDIQAFVPLTSRRILEFGASTGALGGALKRRQHAFITGVERDPVYAREAAGRLDEVIVGDIEELTSRIEQESFDCFIAADVLEHTIDPWSVLRQVVPLLEPGGMVIVSVPNVLYWRALRRLLVHRRWPRDELGIFDRTHLRWFTMKDAHALLEQAQLERIEVHPMVWERGWLRILATALLATPVREFVPGQAVAVGFRPR